MQLTELESKVMKVVWEKSGKATVNEILENWKEPKVPKYTTVLKVLQILEEKGIVRHKKVGKAYKYIAKMTKKDSFRYNLKKLVTDFFGGDKILLASNLISDSEFTTEELEAFSDDIFTHFYSHSTYPIEVEEVTYTGTPAEALGINDLEYILNINQGGSTTNERAKQQYLAVLLNVTSLKLPQSTYASEDGATVAQAIIYINDLLGVDDELAKDLAETLNQAELIAAGIIPLSTANVLFGDDDEALIIPKTHKILTVYPNPFNPTTTFSFALSEAGDVRLLIYDIGGRLLSTLFDEHYNEGVYEAIFDGSGLASGVYLYHFDAGEHQIIGKMVMVK